MNFDFFNRSHDVKRWVFCKLPLFGTGYVVSVRKGCFFPLAASIFGFDCAAYLCTPPHKTLIFLPGEKIPAFQIGNQ